MSCYQLPVASLEAPLLEADWPAEVELVLSALEAADGHPDNRRWHLRIPHRVPAKLRLFTDSPADAPKRLYGRDVSARGFGFVCRHRLPLGYGGVLSLPTPNRCRILRITATLHRCRGLSGDWFEGSLCFNREQTIFSPQ